MLRPPRCSKLEDMRTSRIVRERCTARRKLRLFPQFSARLARLLTRFSSTQLSGITRANSVFFPPRCPADLRCPSGLPWSVTSVAARAMWYRPPCDPRANTGGIQVPCPWRCWPAEGPRHPRLPASPQDLSNRDRASTSLWKKPVGSGNLDGHGAWTLNGPTSALGYYVNLGSPSYLSKRQLEYEVRGKSPRPLTGPSSSSAASSDLHIVHHARGKMVIEQIWPTMTIVLARPMDLEIRGSAKVREGSWTLTVTSRPASAQTEDSIAPPGAGAPGFRPAPAAENCCSCRTPCQELASRFLTTFHGTVNICGWIGREMVGSASYPGNGRRWTDWNVSAPRHVSQGAE